MLRQNNNFFKHGYGIEQWNTINEFLIHSNGSPNMNIDGSVNKQTFLFKPLLDQTEEILLTRMTVTVGDSTNFAYDIFAGAVELTNGIIFNFKNSKNTFTIKNNSQLLEIGGVIQNGEAFQKITQYMNVEFDLANIYNGGIILRDEDYVRVIIQDALNVIDLLRVSVRGLKRKREISNNF